MQQKKYSNIKYILSVCIERVAYCGVTFDTDWKKPRVFFVMCSVFCLNVKKVITFTFLTLTIFICNDNHQKRITGSQFVVHLDGGRAFILKHQQRRSTSAHLGHVTYVSLGLSLTCEQQKHAFPQKNRQ